MHTITQAYRSATDLYWIAFLLTARTELSLSVTLEAVNSGDGLEHMCSPESLARLRKTVVIAALDAMRCEIAESASQIASQQRDEAFIAVQGWFLDPNISKAQVEAALVAIEAFPRCALLLTVFEGLQPEDAAALLHSDRELISRGRMRGLRDLTRNLASITSTAPGWRRSSARRNGHDCLRPKLL
jgi:hypothetical protein